MRLPYSAVFLSLLALPACERAPEKPSSPAVASVMPNLPLPPNGEFVSRSGGNDALQLVFQSPAKADFVTAYYRDAFTTGGWNLVSDTRQPDSTIVLYAEQSGHPMWVRIKPTGTTTRVELMGAIPGADTAYARAAKAAHDSSNTMKTIRR